MSLPPNLICPGAQKAGTTTLFNLLKESEEVFIPPRKELHFFENPLNYSKGLNWYLSHYKNSESFKIRADFTPNYLLFESVPGRIKALLGPDLKFVILLRHPVDRAFSQFNFYRQHQVEKGNDFEKAIESEPISIAAREFDNWYTPRYYLSRGLYYPQLKRYIDQFSKEQIFVIIFEEFFSDKKQDILNDLSEFLGIPSLTTQGQQHSNKTQIPHHPGMVRFFQQEPYLKSLAKRLLSQKNYQKIRNNIYRRLHRPPAKLDEERREQLLKKYFQDDIQKLEQLLNRKLTIWTLNK